MKASTIFSTLALAIAALASPVVEERAATTTSSTAAATPTNYGNYGKYGTYGNYGKYSRSAEAEADIEALLELASAIKAKREADF